MELEVFKFTNESLFILQKLKSNLNHASDFLDDFFFNLLNNSCDGFFNISTRVKSSSSLKEKIIRNNYYLKIDNLPTYNYLLLIRYHNHYNMSTMPNN